MGALRVGISLTDTDSAADELLLRRYLSSGNGVGHWRMGNASQYPAALIAAIWGLRRYRNRIAYNGSSRSAINRIDIAEVLRGDVAPGILDFANFVRAKC